MRSVFSFKYQIFLIESISRKVSYAVDFTLNYSVKLFGYPEESIEYTLVEGH